MTDIKSSPGNEDQHYNGDYQPFEVAAGRGEGPAVCKFHIDKYINRKPKPHISKSPKEVRLEDLSKAKWYLEQLILIESFGPKTYIESYWNQETISEKDYGKFFE